MALVLITGTSSGIGLASAIACAERGFEVIATMRNLERSAALAAEVERLALAPRSAREPAGRGVVHIEQLDVTGVRAGEKVRELVLKYGPIECLVNNAGIAVGGVFEEQSELDIRDQFETNVFGLMAVTRALLPTMRANRRGRVINVSSIAGRIGLPGVAVYAATKHAIGGFSEALRHEVARFGVEVCLVEPGTFKTGIFMDNQRRARDLDEQGPYRELTQTMEKLFLGAAEAADGPEVVGAKIAELLEIDAPPFRTVVGSHARAAAALKRVAPDGIFSSAMRRLMGL